MNFMQRLAACGQEAKKLEALIRMDQRLIHFKVGNIQGMGFAFRVNPPSGSDLEKYKINCISISVPPDANQTYLTYEIAMFSGEKITYQHPHCTDVMRFNKYDSLVKAILTFNTGEFESSDEEEPEPEPEPEPELRDRYVSAPAA
jgi:hypothetical protein